MYFWTLKAVILGKLINLAVGRKRVLQAKTDKFVRKTCEVWKASRKGQALFKC